MSELLLFVLFGAIAIIAAFGVVLLSNPVHSALSLVLTLGAIAGVFLLKGAYFLSAAQIIVYTGAIVVLFLFVIMLLGVDTVDYVEEKLLRRTGFVYGFVGAVLVLLVAGVVGVAWLGNADSSWGISTGAPGLTAPIVAGTGNVEGIAQSLFTTYLLPFELTSILVVAAIVGGIALAKRARRSYGAGIGLPRELVEKIKAADAAAEGELEVAATESGRDTPGDTGTESDGGSD